MRSSTILCGRSAPTSTGADGAVQPPVRALTPAVELVLEVEVVREPLPGSKLVRRNRCDRSSTPLACGSAASRITQPTPS